MFADLPSIIYWWVLVFGLGVINYPLASFFFNKFFDRGYAFSKIMAILLVSYGTWLLGSLKILPFFNETIWLIIFAGAAANIWLFKQKNQEYQREIENNWKIFVFEEILFFVALIFWSFIRGFQPSIHGLEKFMDYGFVNSILRSKYFPPADMWLAGETINYYYFGHLISAVLTKLSGIDSTITYNLMMATIFALSFSAAFSLGGNLIWLSSKLPLIKKKKKTTVTLRHAIARLNVTLLGAGLLSAFLLALGGNLHPLYWFATQGNFKTYWYPDATRFIVPKFGATDNTIHEFPIYSFVVADLHGHMIDIPNVLLILALILTLTTKLRIKKKPKQLLPQIFLLSLCFAIAFMTNAWNYPIYLLVLGGMVLLFNKLNWPWDKALIQTSITCGLLVVSSLLLSLPFHLHFKNIAKGVTPVDFRSPPWMLLVLWGLPLFTTLSYLVITKHPRKTKTQKQINYFILVLLVVSWFLILIPEFVYVKDIYIHSHQRANTMFKLTYQSFMMFSFATGYVVFRALAKRRQGLLKFVFGLFFLGCFIPVAIYPYFAIRSYYGLETYQGLYGLNWMKSLHPDDYQATLWLKKNISGQPVIVEAVGESYSNFARVSTNTGLPAVLGWRVHEWLWRGSFDESGKRTEEVKTIYESTDLNQTKELLNKYRVQLIFVGDMERQAYPNLQESKFDQLGEVIFSSKKTKIYQIN